ncbi:MAG TPA: SDR family oxidoreductase [Bacteroidales bacterium]|nr:SDR family oxidoreductase [Bacteroidales bacterium]
MKIAIFGASGRTGILTVYQALNKGHLVTAFARKPSSVTIQHKNLQVVQGDILEYDKVKQAVEGQDVIISALGVESRKPTTVLSEGTRNILRAMEECKVSRFICMSSAGILGNDAGILFGKIIMPLFLKQIFIDKVRQMKIIQETNLDWVIVRPTGLTDAPKTGKYKITMGPPVSRRIPRADVADFMLKLMTDKQYDHQMPAIAS